MPYLPTCSFPNGCGALLACWLKRAMSEFASILGMCTSSLIKCIPRVEMCGMYWSWSGLQKSENVGRRSSLKFLNHDVNNGWFSGSKTPSNNLGVSKPSIGTAPSRMSASFLAPSRNRPSVDLWVTQHMSKLLLVAFWLLHQFHLPTNLPGRSEWEVTRNRLRSWGEVGMQRAKAGAIDNQNGGMLACTTHGACHSKMTVLSSPNW